MDPALSRHLAWLSRGGGGTCLEAVAPSNETSPTPAMSTYDALHRQCQTLESLFDVKLTSYSRLAATISSGSDVEAGGSSERWKDLGLEVGDLLEKLGETNDQLSALTHDSNNPLSPSMLRTIQRHREIYDDYDKEFRRTKTNIQHALDQANLLSGVRNDIDAYKSSAADSLLAERGRIDSSHRMTDDLIQQAYETRQEFSQQRTSLSGINARMAGVLNTMPGVNNLLSMIKSRRRRDSIILGCIIGVCLLLLLSYMSR